MNCHAQPEVGSGHPVWFVTENLTVTEGGIPSPLVVEKNAAFDVSIDYALSGLWGGFLGDILASASSSAEFKVTAETLGPGADMVLATANVNFVASTLGYTATITVPPNTLVEGAYKLTGLVTVPDFSPIAGYCEGPVLQIKSA